MSFNAKTTIISLLLLIGLPYAAYRYYRYVHPKYIPPPPRPTLTITIIPGWNLRQVADYLIKQGLAKDRAEVFAITGAPAAKGSAASASLVAPNAKILADMPSGVGLEGYLAPETYQVYRDAPLADIIQKVVLERDAQFGSDWYAELDAQRRSVHQALTMASIIEEEVRFDTDRAMVADILWRRIQQNWPLQVDSSIHYLLGSIGTVYTSDKDRAIDSPWNTYKYPGLPPGPIGNPGIASIQAALYPEKNDYWYFLSDSQGKIHYAKTLAEQAANSARYLK